jgi:hypothetical protein
MERRETCDSEGGLETKGDLYFFLYHRLTMSHIHELANWDCKTKSKFRHDLLYILGFETTRVHVC